MWGAGISNREAGFTLLELALVILLLGLFSAMTLPLIGGPGQNALDASARRLSGTVKYLFNEAALAGQEFRLTCDLKAGTFEAGRLEPDGEWTEVSGPGRRQRLRDGVRFEDIAVAGRGTTNHDEVSLRILPEGWMDETVVHLTDGEERKLTLRINSFTGNTEVYAGYRDFF